MGQPTKSKTFILTSCLVAVSFAIINCQKAPNRNGVKPTVATPAGVNTKAEAEPKSECSTEVKSAVETMRNITKEVKVTEVSSTGKSGTEKDTLISKRNIYVENCDSALKELDKVPEKSCLMKKDFKSSDAKEMDRNKIGFAEVKRACDDAKKLKEEDTKPAGSESGAAATETPEQKKKREDAAALPAAEKANKSAIEYLSSHLELASDEVKDMSTDNKDSEGKAAFKKFFVDGDIKSERALELANTGKKVICSISGDKIDKKVNKSVILKFVGTDTNAYAKAENVLDGFKGDATTVMLSRVNDKSEKAMLEEGKMESKTLSVTCLNIKNTAVNLKAMKDALGIDGSKGKHIKQRTEAEVKELTTKNEIATKAEIARTSSANAGQNGGGQQGGSGSVSGSVAGGPAAGTTTVDEKTKLTREAQSLRMARDAQKQSLEALAKQLADAITAVNATSEARKPVDKPQLTDLAKKLKEAGDAYINAKAEQTKAEAGKETEVIAKARATTAAAKKKVDDLEKEALKSPDIKKLAAEEDEAIKKFTSLHVAFFNAVENQKKLYTQQESEKLKLAEMEAKYKDAVTKALLKGATQQEIDAAATTTIKVD